MVKKKFDTSVWGYIMLLLALGMLVSCNIPTKNLQAQNQNEANQNNLENQPGKNEDQDQVNQDPGQNQVEEQGEENGAVQEVNDQWVYIDHGGFGFWYDPTVIEDILPETVPLAQEAPYQEAHPPFVQYSLLLDSGTISVVEVDWYKDISQTATEIFPELEELIQSQTPLGLDCIPELPLLSFARSCFHQQFNANIGFVDFKNGSGVRFVAVYAIQDTAAIDNQHLVYVYQGITDDGQCYVNATFRLTHEALEEYAEVPAEVYADMTGEIMHEYFFEYERMLDTDPGGYMPLLDRFDLIMQSIEVSYCTSG